MITARHAANAITKGQVVAYPTESSYALGVDATNPKAIRKLFRLKKREAKKPIALVAADVAQVQKYFIVSSDEMKIIKKHWPGPLTLLLQPKTPTGKLGLTTDERVIATAALGIKPSRPQNPGQSVVGSIINTLAEGKLPTPILVGVRVPGHGRARRLASLAGVPLTATSANISGQPPTKSARTVKKSFPNVAIMNGDCGKQTKPSTVAEIRIKEIKIHRAGAIKLS